MKRFMAVLTENFTYFTAIVTYAIKYRSGRISFVTTCFVSDYLYRIPKPL